MFPWMLRFRWTAEIGGLGSFLGTATKPLLCPILPIQGTSFVVGFRHLPIVGVTCTIEHYEVELDVQNPFGRIVYPLFLVADILGEHESELENAAWYQSVMELGTYDTGNEWRVTASPGSRLCT